ncbi:monocarboxylate transporter 12-like isoform X2 [Dermacentor silvarum]|uniref:monocarboxylate transporter 12-like isoform X1 n=1 Tax=Dermacentor silvarum TaxID=543639 RepID=UPI002100B9DA|nr:monocarboxylate transporter 12-like isoform X1 [Dermacentor silvarum]XP_049524371.1 monocarboxylate transporter 12-like isoform X2 [Dermacentor silvarum]
MPGMSTESRLKMDPVFGVDSRHSWVTAAFCGALLFLALSTISVSGVFFYGIVEAFGVNREQASWPVTLSGSMLPLAGPLTGMLCARFSCRKVILVCSFIAGIAVSLCYFAESTPFIVVFFGIINGTTLSGLYIAANVLVAEYFEKRRATACSFMFTAGGLNTVVFPPLIELFYSRYGIHAAFLLYGAILMNAFPCCIALRDPPWLDKPKSLSKRKCRTFDTVGTARSPVCEDRSSEQFNMEKCVEGTDELQVFLDKRTVEERVTSVSFSNSNGTSNFSRFLASRRLERKDVFDCFKRGLAPFATMSFLVSAVSFTVVNFGMALYVMLSTDLASDHGIEPSSSVFLLHAFSASDIVSRALSGVIIDSKILSLESVMLLGYLVQGAAFEMLAWFGTFQMMLTASALMGLTCGARIALQAPVVAKHFGLKKLPLVMGAVYFCIGVALLLRPPIVGYFRDRHGSYSGLLHSTAAVNGLLAIIWILRLLNGKKEVSPTKVDQSSEEI